MADQLRWARFHLGDGRAESGVRVLPAEVLHRMKEPTGALRGSNLGDVIGIGWFLHDVDGVRTVGHGGSANGQFAELLTVPNGTSPSSRCPTSARTAYPSTKPKSGGRSRPTWG